MNQEKKLTHRKKYTFEISIKNSFMKRLIINIIAGQTTGSVDYDASLSRTFSMEIMHSGEIIFNMD